MWHHSGTQSSLQGCRLPAWKFQGLPLATHVAQGFKVPWSGWFSVYPLSPSLKLYWKKKARKYFPEEATDTKAWLHGTKNIRASQYWEGQRHAHTWRDVFHREVNDLQIPSLVSSTFSSTFRTPSAPCSLLISLQDSNPHLASHCAYVISTILTSGVRNRRMQRWGDPRWERLSPTPHPLNKF